MTRRATKPPTTPEPVPELKQTKIRQPRSIIDEKLAAYLRSLREAAGYTLLDVSKHMDYNGEPHSSVALWRERLGKEGETKAVKNGAIKSPLSIEGVGRTRSAITVSELVTYCAGVDKDPARVLEGAGLARQAITVEDAIEGDPRLTERDRETALSFFRSLVRGR